MQTENEKVFKNSDRVAFHFQNPQQLSWNRVLNIPFSFCSRLWIRRRRLIQYRIPVLLKNHNRRCIHTSGKNLNGSLSLNQNLIRFQFQYPSLLSVF